MTKCTGPCTYSKSMNQPYPS